MNPRLSGGNPKCQIGSLRHLGCWRLPSCAQAMRPTKRGSNMRGLKNVIPGAVAACAMAFVTTANAQAPEYRSTTPGPNTELIGVGIFTLAVPYFASVAVATSNPGHDNLYIPVAGPWLHLAERSSCSSPMDGCDGREDLYKFLLVGDGILQGLGALEMLAGLLSSDPRAPAPRTAARPTGPSLHVAPSPVGRSGYGIGAVGTF